MCAKVWSDDTLEIMEILDDTPGTHHHPSMQIHQLPKESHQTHAILPIHLTQQRRSIPPANPPTKATPRSQSQTPAPQPQYRHPPTITPTQPLKLTSNAHPPLPTPLPTLHHHPLSHKTSASIPSAQIPPPATLLSYPAPSYFIPPPRPYHHHSQSPIALPILPPDAAPLPIHPLQSTHSPSTPTPTLSDVQNPPPSTILPIRTTPPSSRESLGLASLKYTSLSLLLKYLVLFWEGGPGR